MTDDPLDDDDRQRVIPNIEMSKRLLKNNPDEVVGLHNLAWALILTGKSAEGMDVLHRLSLEVGSHRWFFLLSYAAALTRAGLHNRAREALVDALAEEPLISNSHLVALLCERNSLELLKVEDEAGLKLAKIVGAASLSRLALMNALEGNNRKAEDMFKAALSRQPSMSGAWYFLSRVELCNSQASEARLSFRRASFLGWRNTAIDVEAQFNSELERRYAFRHIGLSPIFPLGLALAANIPMRDATHFCGVGTK